jgi:NOL1/NOP2/fmu family ribosome biogenesis protein
VFLNPYKAPTIIWNPQSVTKLTGGMATFSLTVTGTPPFSFEWRFNGTNLADGSRISGTRTSSLTITSVQSQDAGFYTAVVSNPWGSATSAPALLRVLSVERLTLSVSNQTPASFDFTNAAWVEVVLTNAGFPNPLIWYTLDSSPPSPASGSYSGTLIVSNTVVVRAIAYNPVDFSSVEMAPVAVNLWTGFHLFAATTTGGMVALDPPGGFYRSNAVVTLRALPEAGWELLNWTGDASGTSSNLSVVVDRDKSVTAQFALIPRFTLGVATVGSGTVSGNTQSNYLRGTTVNLSAQPSPGWEFLSWTGDASGTSSNISVVMDRSKSVTAQFGRNAFTLTVTTLGSGTVSGNTQSNYLHGTTVNLSAEPAPGWYFQSWSGDASGTLRNVSVVVDRDKSVVAHFPPLTLLAMTAGGGTIAANPASNYVQDSTVELTAQPHSGWTFLNWMGDASGTNPQASVTMDQPKEVQAVFGTECKTNVVGQGTVVRSFGTGLIPFGTVLRLAAIPQPGYYLGLWGSAASSQVNPLDFTVTNATPTVSALFVALGANQATLTVLEQGAGVVAREPQANAYTKGQAVLLMAQPFPGQDFLGWAGDASGTQNPLTVTVTTNQTITATFTHRLGLAIQPWPAPTQRRGFLFLLAGDEGNSCLVQTSPDLADWQPLTTLTISNTAAQFIDVAVTNHSPRFYRGVLR